MDAKRAHASPSIALPSGGEIIKQKGPLMAKKDKENFSISVDPRAMRSLQAIADRRYFGNRSVAAEKAIWEFVVKELIETPEARELIYNNLDINSN